jgi:DNA-directed RNA polymerase specialized sigma54-like protein
LLSGFKVGVFMKLGYELNIAQMQKLVMTPELIQAIQILQFNTQELESFVEEQLLTNPILEVAPPTPTESEQAEQDARKVRKISIIRLMFRKAKMRSTGRNILKNMMILAIDRKTT